VAIDVVADPSVPTAFVNGILESKQWMLDDSGEFLPFCEKQYSKFESSLDKLPSKNKNEYLKEQILDFIKALTSLSRVELEAIVLPMLSSII